MKKAFVTGITGQDGSYLAELLIDKGYEVHGLVRRSSLFNIGRIEHIYSNAANQNGKEQIHLHYGDLADFSSLFSLIDKIRPHEVYHLGAMSDVRISFEMPEYTGNVTGLGTMRVLEAVRLAKLYKTKVYFASSSEIFGKVIETPQKETTPFYPRSPYAAAKVYGHWTAKNYREAYGMFISSGILFNHESPRRGENFVTRKITRGIAGILAGTQKKIQLGNIKAKRDWGYAPDYVKAMWMMLQHNKPDDFVIATGEMHSVEEFLKEAFSYAGIPNWKKYIEIKKELFRPSEADILLGDSSKAHRVLGWKPAVTFKQLVRIMVDADKRTAGLLP